MAYIGAEPVPGQNREVDDISSGFNGNATAFTLQVSSVNVSPESANNILINLGGVLQNPDTDYTINASTLTFTTAPASGLSFFGLILGAGINTATVADGAITTAKLASDAVGANQLANTSVTAGSYTTADITVDAQGRITAAASGTISGAEIADQAVTNAKVNNSAAIAGTKISPDFGSQNIATTGTAATGALTVTGAITASTSITATGNLNTNGNFTISGTNPNIFLTDTNNDSDFRISNSNGILEFRDVTNSVTRVMVASNGDIGIGTTTLNRADAGRPLVQFDYSGSDGSEGLELRLSNSAINGNAATDNAAITYIGQTLGITNRENGTIQFRNNGSERMRIDASGRLLIGTTTARGLGNLEIEGTSFENSGLTLVRNVNSTGSTSLNICKSRGGIGSVTSVANNDVLGGINFRGADGANLRDACDIRGEVDGTPSQGTDMPGRLAFRTSADGSSSPTERMRIDSVGRVMVGVTSASDSATALTLKNMASGNEHTLIEMICDDNQTTRIEFSETSTSRNASIRYSFTSDLRAMTFHTDGATERMRIDSAGRVSIGTTDNSAHFNVHVNAASRVPQIINDTNNTATFTHRLRFDTGGTEVGRIRSSNSATVYDTSASDITLKKNFEDWTENTLKLFKNINPQKFHFIQEEDTAEKSKGFIAQEMVDSFPEAYTKEDKEDSKYFFNPSGMVVYLMKAIQELEAKVAALEAA